ncbi:MAG: M12 family metallo-peptidase [Planctomycetota bacterium]
MNLPLPLLTGAGIGAAVLATAASAQDVSGPAVRQAPLDLLGQAGLTEATVQILDDLPYVAGETFHFPLWIDGATRDVTVWPYSVRAAGYRLMVGDGSGQYTEYPTTIESTYRGEVEGYPGSVVAVNLYEGQLQGTIQLAKGAPLWGLQPSTGLIEGSPWNEHLVYNSENLLPLDVSCGGALEVIRTDGESGFQPGPDGSNPRVCEIAIDSDVEYYNSNGQSVTATENDITNVINATEAIYEATADIFYDITVIFVETSEPDPYDSFGANAILNDFQDHWNASHQSDPRDIAHLFTGKNITGSTIGIAYLNVICNKQSGYGVSQSKFSGSFTFRVGLTAHELGHNWSAGHCDGAGDCKIMCSGIGGCAGSLTSFGNGSTNAINNKKASSGCLSTPPPPTAPLITSLSPNTVQAFQGNQVSLGGFFLEQTTQISVGGTVLTAPFGFTVESDNLITFNPPIASSLGSVQVTAINEAGSSNVLTLNYAATEPSKLAATGTALTGLAFNWNFGAQPNDLWYLFASVNDATTVPFGGFDLLANGLLIFSGNLNGGGTGSASILVPPGASGATVYSQVVLLDDASFAFQSATNVTTSSILF